MKQSGLYKYAIAVDRIYTRLISELVRNTSRLYSSPHARFTPHIDPSRPITPLAVVAPLPPAPLVPRAVVALANPLRPRVCVC